MKFLNLRQLNYKIKRDPEAFFSKCTPMERALLDLLFYWDTTKHTFSEYQDRMAAIIGCTRIHVNKMISKFSKWGIVQKSGAYDEKKTYVINPFFRSKRVRKHLSSTFATFKKYTAAIVFSLCLITPAKLTSSLSTKFNLKSESVYITHAPARQTGSGNSLDPALQATLLSKKEIKQRKTVISEPRLHAIMEINKIFPLTPHGIVKLSVYSAAALQYAYKQADMALTKYDPFGYIANLCNEFDAKSGANPDWEAYHLRREALGIDKEDRIFMDQERLDAMVSTQESPRPTASLPVNKPPKREPDRDYSLRHTPEQIRNMAIPISTENPVHNSAAFFASLLLGNK